MRITDAPTRCDVPRRDLAYVDAYSGRRATGFRRGMSGQYRLDRQRRTQNQARYNSQPHSLSLTLTCSILRPRRPHLATPGALAGALLRDSPLAPSVPPAPRLAVLHLFEGVLLETPSVDRLDIEAPVAANLERR